LPEGLLIQPRIESQNTLQLVYWNFWLFFFTSWNINW
jgi:hypothetical protein